MPNKKRKTDQKAFVEPICRPNDGRYVMFPIQHADVWGMYEQAENAFWRANEVRFDQDLKDWPRLTDDERFFITHVLAFFAASDGIVIENLGTRFLSEVQIPEIRAFYTMQMQIETVHSITYSLLIDTYVTDPQEKQRLFTAVDHFPAIKEKADWAIKWIEDQEANFATRLVAFAIVEGIFFSGSFCAIFWFKRRGLLPGLTFSNELISRDEGMHTKFAALLYRTKIERRLPVSTVHAMVREAVDIETRFVTEALPVKLLGMNAKDMTTYIQFVANHLLRDLGVPKLWPDATDPFNFNKQQSMEGKTNFFEREVSEYKKADISQTPFDPDGSF